MLIASAVAGAQAGAVVLPPTTLDGPSSAIGEFGGAAVSADGSGGLVYVKQTEGVPHVFAAQFADGHWSAPVRVDWASSYPAGAPRIAAADGGRLVVVWVSEIATVGGRIQDALMSSTLDPGAGSFGPPYVVDPNVAEGVGVSPSLAVAATGQGLVAYRVVTNDFKTSETPTTIVPLRPGDALADIRVARYEGDQWSAPQRVNRDPLLTMRAPSDTNGPQVALGRGEQAVVAWQEPESDGVARLWVRRVFGTTLGLVLQASPSTLAGAPVTADADAAAVSVGSFGETKVVGRIAGAAGANPAQPLLFENTLPSSTTFSGYKFNGALPIGGGVEAGAVGAPSVSVDDQGSFRLAFIASGAARVMTGSEDAPATPEVALGPVAAAGGAGAATSLNPDGGGVTAWPSGQGGVAVREDFPAGGAQLATVSGSLGGPISELDVGGSESGESIVGFRQGEASDYEIVGDRISVPPPPFVALTPRVWLRPRAAAVSWTNDEDAAGGVTYSVLIDGHLVLQGLHGLSALPPRKALGSGIRIVQVISTDANGQQTLSSEAHLMVDGSPPVATVRHAGGYSVVVRVRDAQSGAVASATSISFGDGALVRGKLSVRHGYARAGRYTIVVRMRDKLGNAAVAHIRVSVP